MDPYVNLNEQGALRTSGRRYSDVSDEEASEASTFLSRMEASQSGLKGDAGTRFRNAAGQSSSNLTQLANLIADQALRAVRGEDVIVSSDEEGTTALQNPLSALDAHGTELTRPIEA